MPPEIPVPYSWMLNDLERSINDAQANYLVGLGLFCYSEIIGRHILKVRGGAKKKIKNEACFKEFVGEYMGYKWILEKYPKIYDWFRHGLCHEYYIKGKIIGIFVEFDRSIDGPGIVIVDDKKYLIIKPYFRDFKAGIIKFLAEKK